MKRLSLSILSFFLIPNVPTVAYAQVPRQPGPLQVSIKQVVAGITTDLATLTPDEGSNFILLAPCTPPAVPPCTQTYGIFTIRDASAEKRAQVKIEGITIKKLTLTDAIIRNVAGATDTFADLLINSQHQYVTDLLQSGVADDAQQYFGLTASGNFVRGIVVATNDSLTARGFGGFDACNDGCEVEAQFGNTLSYTVSGAALSSNTITPSPLQTTDNFSCNQVAEGCDLTIPAFIRTEATIHLRRNDIHKLLGSINAVVVDSTVVPNAQEVRDRALSLLGLDVDIKPGNSDSRINLRSKGGIPVAILGSPTFDVMDIDPLSVQFGPNGATEAHGRGRFKDVNGDGFLDLVLHFRTQETGLECGDTSATLTGQTFDGEPIEGSDSIQVRPCK